MINLINDDCLIAIKSIPDKSIDLILQDPPYNVTACEWEWDIMSKIDEFWLEWKRIIKTDGVIVMTATQPFTSKLIMSNLDMFRYCWYWKKSKATGWQHSKNKPMTIIEECCVFSRLKMGHMSQLGGNRMRYNPQGVESSGIKKITHVKHGRTMGARPNQIGVEYESFTGFPTNFLEYQNVTGNQAHHPTQKPVVLMEYLIKTYTNENDTVFDGFMGSGTTGVACKNLNRNFIGCELDENYFNMAKNRIELA